MKRQRAGAERGSGKLAYSYRRFSSKNQTDNTSLQRQLEIAQSVCDEKGWTLVDLPPDEGISAWKGLNKIKGTLGSFLKKVKEGQIPRGSVLIIENFSRFSRDEVFPVVADVKDLMDNGIEIYSCVDRTHYTPTQMRENKFLIHQMIMAIQAANEYSTELGRRITRAVGIRLDQCQQGLKMNLGSWLPRWVDFVGDDDRKPGEFRLNAHADTIKRIVEEYLAGQSMYKIARVLIKDKLPTLAGGKWCQGTIGHLLGSKNLLGDLEVKEVKLPHYVPAVITKIQYDKLQAKLRENKARRGGDGASDYVANLFRNRCKCAHCGETMTTQKVSGCSHHNYTCKGKRVGKCRSKYSIKVSEIETDFFLLFLQQSPEDLLTKNTDQHSNAVAKLQSAIAGYDKQIEDLAELVGSLPIPELKQKLTVLENKRQTAKGELDKVNAQMLSSRNIPKALANIKEIVGNFFDPKSVDSFLKCYEKGKSIYGPSIDAISYALNSDPSTVRFNKAVLDLQSALKDNETRKQLLTLLPSIVHQLVIDTTKGGYFIVSHNGTKSDFREVIE